MYEFIDVTETSEGYILPSEALQINGEYIENQISGYRTLNVEGREALSPAIDTFTTGIRDGAKVKTKRFPERTIVVTYQLITASNEEFREAYNKLGQILNVDDARLIFNDEQDKYFIGTPSYIESVPPGLNSVVGKFEILCLDPFKYSVMEYEAEPSLDDNSILIDYNGTYKAYPVLEAQFAETDNGNDGESGYVAFYTEDGKTIQLGNPDEKDILTQARTQVLINGKYNKETSWGLTEQAKWDLNKADYIIPSNRVGLGTLGMGVKEWTQTSAATTSATILKIRSEAERPYIDYKLVAKATNRTETSVKVTVSVTANLTEKSSYFGNRFGLVAAIDFGDGYERKTLKESWDYYESYIKEGKDFVPSWTGTDAHTITFTKEIKGLTADTDVISGIKFKVTRNDAVSGGGETGKLSDTICKDLPISKWAAAEPKEYYLTPTSYGSATDKWHGPIISRMLPSDKFGRGSFNEWTFQSKIKMKTSTSKQQYGAIQFNFTNSSGDPIAGLRIALNESGKKATAYYYVRGKVIGQNTFDLNSKLGTGATVSLSQKKGKVTIEACGKTHTGSFSVVGNLGSLYQASCMSVMFEKYSTSAALDYLGVSSLRFESQNLDTEEDVANTFAEGDVVQADCNNGEILHNGASAISLGALGNDWEEFYLTPGLNQIGVSYSEWVSVENAPHFKVRYRERFL